MAPRSKSSPTSNGPELKYLTVSDIRDTVHAYVERHMTAAEPVGAWAGVNLPRLQAALDAPREAGFGQEYYPTLADKAAALLYRLAKGHAFENGNKRIATLATFLFLAMNDSWWQATNEDIYVHVAWVAASESRCFDQAMAYLRCYFHRKIIPMNEAAAIEASETNAADG